MERTNSAVDRDWNEETVWNELVCKRLPQVHASILQCICFLFRIPGFDISEFVGYVVII